MLQNFMTPFKAEEEDENQSKQVMKRKKKVNNNNNYQKRNYCSSNLEAEGRRRSKSGLGQSGNMGMDVNNMIGLRLVTQITNSSSHTKPNINVVLKSPNILTKLGNSTSSSSSMEMCFLNTCILCNKKLSHDKDIYMYRGDQGFCSIECRKRQIVMDEMKEAEGRNSNYRICWNDARRRETRLILEDLRLHRIQSNSPHRQNHWAIVS